MIGGHGDEMVQSGARDTDASHQASRRVSRPSGLAPHRLALVVLLLGLALTAVLTAVSRLNYLQNEQRLTDLDTKLTASALGVAQVDLERRLGTALDLATGAPDPSAVFRRAIAASMAPAGPFVFAGLHEVTSTGERLLTMLGGPTLKDPRGQAARALVERSARSKELITIRVMSGRQQRFLYLLSTPTSTGALVAAASQHLPANRRITIPSQSPDADLYIALYDGTALNASSLIETNAPHLPLGSPSSSARVPFGTSTITLVAAPRTSLAGAWSAFVPWGILIVGILVSLAIATLTERLLRRRRRAEDLATENRRLYAEQRSISETLQRSLLPRELPRVEGLELAGRYLGGTAGIEVGGDWYSAIRSGEHGVTFVVGDVSGRGVRAATVMARLRYTVRTLASLGFSPATVLEMTGRELDITADGHFATVLVGSVDVDRGELVLASAGHLPPLQLAASGASFLDAPVGPPLGLGTAVYEQRALALAPGTTLVAFTDGLIERRGAALDVQLQHLREVASGSEPSAAALVELLVAELATPPPEDDVAVLGLRLLP